MMPDFFSSQGFVFPRQHLLELFRSHGKTFQPFQQFLLFKRLQKDHCAGIKKEGGRDGPPLQKTVAWKSNSSELCCADSAMPQFSSGHAYPSVASA